MLRFCPDCGNHLVVESASKDRIEGVHLHCSACGYEKTINIGRSLVYDLPVKRKEVDDVLGGADAWANVDSTEARCPKCAFEKAYYMQIQTRSADEPMSTFYKCCKCGNRWREG